MAWGEYIPRHCLPSEGPVSLKCFYPLFKWGLPHSSAVWCACKTVGFTWRDLWNMSFTWDQLRPLLLLYHSPIIFFLSHSSSLTCIAFVSENDSQNYHNGNLWFRKCFPYNLPGKSVPTVVFETDSKLGFLRLISCWLMTTDTPNSCEDNRSADSHWEMAGEPGYKLTSGEAGGDTFRSSYTHWWYNVLHFWGAWWN